LQFETVPFLQATTNPNSKGISCDRTRYFPVDHSLANIRRIYSAAKNEIMLDANSGVRHNPNMIFEALNVSTPKTHFAL
jgi:hypothetical protein